MQAEGRLLHAFEHTVRALVAHIGAHPIAERAGRRVQRGNGGDLFGQTAADQLQKQAVCQQVRAVWLQ